VYEKVPFELRLSSPWVGCVKTFTPKTFVSFAITPFETSETVRAVHVVDWHATELYVSGLAVAAPIPPAPLGIDEPLMLMNANIPESRLMEPPDKLN
jgi:hypothetical protein